MQFSTEQTMSPVAMEPGTTLFKSTTIRAVRPAGRRPLADTSTTSSTQQQQQKQQQTIDHAVDYEDDELHDGDDEGEEKPVLPSKDSSINRTTTTTTTNSNNTNGASVDEYGFLIKPEHARLKNRSALHR